MRPLILITNDDGVRSPGLHALAEVALTLGDVVISAPAMQQTSMSRGFKHGGDAGRITAIEVALDGRLHPAYGVDGSPAMAAAHGVLELSPRRPDLCLSGINYGENLGFSLTRSGTLGAAMEAAAFGIPGIAISLETHPSAHFSDNFSKLDWSVAQDVAKRIAVRVLEQGLPEGTHVLNINVPDSATTETPLRWTRQSLHNYYTYLEQPTRDHALPYRLKEDRIIPPDVERDSDVYAFSVERAISITPLTADLTACGFHNGWLDHQG
ncbi:MAG: 5'/3'-nucleotidase SurE [Anaerolineae bacterium]|nr:5'/3'-nucleotidase SurE [Anaerolineae bacterium]